MLQYPLTTGKSCHGLNRRSCGGTCRETAEETPERDEMSAEENATMSPYDVPIFGRLAWNDVIVLAWFAATVLSVAYIAIDIRTTPENKVIKAAWVLTGLYMGPIAAALYVLADKEPSPGTHEDFIAPQWKQALGSTLHCVAGDATGVIIAATVTGLLGLPMWLDMTCEYVAGFVLGLFIFQALFMRDMFGGSYRQALKRSILPEWLSMNTMMAGMFPVMVRLMMGRDMRAMDPRELLYWGVMATAITVGFFTAYPMNWWLVSRGLKHGLMTVRDDRQPAGTAMERMGHAGHAAQGGVRWNINLTPARTRRKCRHNLLRRVAITAAMP